MFVFLIYYAQGYLKLVLKHFLPPTKKCGLKKKWLTHIFQFGHKVDF